MIITKNQIRQLIANMLSENLVDLTKPGIERAIDYDPATQPPSFYCNETPHGRSLKRWFEDLVNEGGQAAREKGAPFEDIAMVGMMPHIGPRQLKRYVNLNTTFGVSDSPAADLGAYIDAGRHPSDTNSISVKLTLNSQGAFETSNTAIANLAAMLYDIEKDGKTQAETPLNVLSDRIKVDPRAQSINHDNKQCSYIELPLGLLSAKFNTADILGGLKREGLTTSISVKIPFMNKGLFGSKPISRLNKLNSSFGTANITYFKGNTDDEKFDNAFSAIHHLIGAHIRGVLSDLGNQAVITGLVNQLKASASIKYSAKDHASIVKKYFLTDPGYLKFRSDFANFFQGLSVSKLANFTTVSMEILDPAKNLARNPKQNIFRVLGEILQPRFKLYYAEPKDNKFFVITPDDPNDKTIYVMNPRNASSLVDKPATDINGNKIRSRSFISNLNHFAGTDHVASVFLESNRFTTPNLKPSAVFSPDIYSKIVKALNTKSIGSFASSSASRQTYADVIPFAAAAKKQGSGIQAALSNVQKAQKNLQSVSQKTSNAIPQVFLQILQIEQVFKEIEKYIQNHALKAHSKDMPPLPSIQVVDITEMSQVLDEMLNRIAQHTTKVIQTYDEGSDHMIAIGLTLNILSLKDREKVRNYMPDAIFGKARGKKLVNPAGRLYEQLDYTSDQLAEYFNLQIVIGVAEIAAKLAGEESSLDLSLDVDQDEEYDEEPRLVSEMAENKLYDDILSKILKHLKS